MTQSVFIKVVPMFIHFERRKQDILFSNRISKPIFGHKSNIIKIKLKFTIAIPLIYHSSNIVRVNKKESDARMGLADRLENVCNGINILRRKK